MKIWRRLDWIFLVILIIAALLRIHGLDWDHGYHLHPDERMLIMVTERVKLFDNLDPDFFNYGSLPVYFLRGVAQARSLFDGVVPDYSNLLFLGRYLSVIADLITLFVLGILLFSLTGRRAWAYAAMGVYALAFFPIQNTHFFIVDTFLTCLVTGLAYQLLRLLKAPKFKLTPLILIGLNLGAIFATKVTGLLFLPAVFVAIFLKFYKNKSAIAKIISSLTIVGAVSYASFFLFMPFALLRWSDFIRDITQQMRMNSDPFTFPYTLQYVGTTPYLYHIKNIFLWGFGPFSSILALAGALLLINRYWREVIYLYKNSLWKGIIKKMFNFFVKFRIEITILIFYGLYFIVIGKSAVKFMRYMLPVYPLLSILAGYTIYRLWQARGYAWASAVLGLIVFGLLIWSAMFTGIYSQLHTRIAATNWIHQNIPKNKVLAVEHWDDRLPLFSEYQTFDLPLYNVPDDQVKWASINKLLNQADYIVIASNRLYKPIQNLTDCSKYFNRCYPLASHYYKNLFDGNSQFKLKTEFNVRPVINLLGVNLSLDDQDADESFTVYDHPKIMIFEKMR